MAKLTQVSEPDFIAGFISGCLVMAVILGFCFSKCNDTLRKEGAMKVYNNEATLKYEVVDGVKVDSCVIWKEK